jgi:hypothetical protein
MSVVKDIQNNLKLVNSVLPLLRTADVNGSGVDTQDSVGVALVAHVGTSGDTLSGSVYLALEVEHSDDNSSWSDCADADIDAAVTGANTGTFAKIDDAAEDDAVYKCNYLGNKRYVRVVGNLVGTHTNGISFGAMAVLAPQHAPAA